MMRLYLLSFFWLIANTALAQLGTRTISFHSTKVDVVFDAKASLPRIRNLDADNLVRFYKTLENRPYQTFLSSLQSHQTLLNLNDWYFYELMQKATDQVYVNYSQRQRDLLTWFLLSKAGFDARVAHAGHEVFVYAYSRDQIFECPMFKERGRTYINLSNLVKKDKRRVTSLYTPDFKSNPNGKSFSFDLLKKDNLPEQPGKKTIHFDFEDQRIELEVQYDRALVKRMSQYPFVEESAYIKRGMSFLLKASLLTQLKFKMRGFSQEKSIAFLLALTRSGFKYKEDEDFFGYSKPMVADELFAYPVSDCEDRSALFYNLSKEILGLPMLIITYPDHVSIGVDTDKTVGIPLKYRGKQYTICDPTGPSNSCELGVYPPGYERKRFQVIGSY